MQHSLFYESLCYLSLFGLVSVVTAREEEKDSMNHLNTAVFVEKPLNIPGSSKYVKLIYNVKLNQCKPQRLFAA